MGALAGAAFRARLRRPKLAMRHNYLGSLAGGLHALHLAAPAQACLAPCVASAAILAASSGVAGL